MFRPCVGNSYLVIGIVGCVGRVRTVLVEAQLC